MDVSLREVVPDDGPFLFDVYASTRSREVAALGWDPATAAAFLRMQAGAQEADYRHRYPAARHLVVSCGGVDIGRLYLADLPGEVHIVDVALLPDWRGRGIGTRIVEDVVRDAGDRTVSLHVTRDNPAARLYARLGFVVTASDDLTLRMDRRP